ncbi:MAG: leucine-rich repeat domain-containing protein [Parachlamydiales bacterium]|jgi:Leucine-rich repeat (LRR) protein
MSYILPRLTTSQDPSFDNISSPADDLVESLLEDTHLLQEAILQEIRSDILPKPLLNRVCHLCEKSLDSIFHEKIDSVCRNILGAIQSNEDINKIEILGILKLAIANKSENTINECTRKLNKINNDLNRPLMYCFDKDTLFVYFTNEVLPRHVKSDLRLIGDQIPVELFLSIKKYNPPEVQALLSEVGEKISALHINSCNTNDLKNALILCPNLYYLDISKCSKFSLADIPSLKKLKELFISDCEDIESFPDFSQMVKLEQLAIINCPDFKIEHLTSLPSLLELSLSELKITALPDFSHFPSLKKLFIQSCKITELDITYLQKLTHLSLKKCNKIKTFPDFNQLIDLEELDLSKTKITSLNIPDLKKLTILLLASCEKLTQFPEFQALTQLKELNLKWTQVKKVELSGLIHLEKLNLSRCKHLLSLNCSPCLNLKKLKLAGCLFEYINLKGLNRLSYLDLSYSKIKIKFNSSHCPNLKKLNLEECLIESLELVDFMKLKKLQSWGCPNLKSVVLENLQQLSDVSLGCSPLETLRFANLPNLLDLNIQVLSCLIRIEFKNLLFLKSLRISNCPQLLQLPNLQETPRLKILDLKELNLPTLKIENLSSLSHLRLNDFETSNLSIANLPKLSGLNIRNLHCGNDYSGLRNLPSLAELRIVKSGLENQNLSFLSQFPTLKLLDLSYNWLTYLPHELAELTRLQVLDLDFNQIVSSTLSNQIWAYLSGMFSSTPSRPQLSHLRNLRQLSLRGNELTSVPEGIENLTELYYLDLSKNQITSLPQEMILLQRVSTLRDELLDTLLKDLRGAYMLAANKGKTLKIKLAREDFETKRYDLITELASTLTEEHSKLKITYENEIGDDMSGLSKDYFAQLFHAFAEKCLNQGYPSWSLASKLGDPEKLFLSIGTILAFVFRTEGRYPIGDKFSEGLFNSIKNCTNEIIDTPYENLSVQQLDALAHPELKKAVNMPALLKFLDVEDKEEGKQYISVVKNLLDSSGEEVPDEIKSYFGYELKPEVLEIEEEVFYVFKMQADLESIKKYVLDGLRNYCEDELKAVHAIIRGFREMKPVWDARPKFTVELLQSTIQGNSKRETILASLNCKKVKPKYQKWIRKWIKNASPAQLQSFLIYTVGSTSLKAGQQIKVKVRPGLGMASRTCSDTLEIPPKMKKDMLYFYLNGLKGEKQTFTIV